ncbi:NFX1-type zinc finger-containing protein 1 [Galendromus occidentalis]|uniref:NFX1-type zinc finger-containing protein 1 n=1 Tax=Galendromus occidentalis TaxID=34638 RepID=A0AAJ7SGC3_9ACAR|nr:NFX1-type zinc finger-containing protein 1 [Galendromus occidentalis]
MDDSRQTTRGELRELAALSSNENHARNSRTRWSKDNNQSWMRGRGRGRDFRIHDSTSRGLHEPQEQGSSWRVRGAGEHRPRKPENPGPAGRPPGASQRRELFPITKHKLNDLYKCEPKDLIMELELNPGWGCLLEQKTYAELDEIVVAVKVFAKCLESPNRNVTLAFMRKYFEKFHNYLTGTLVFLFDDLSAKLALVVRDIVLLYQTACTMMPGGVFQVVKVLLSIISRHAGVLQRKLQHGNCNLLEMLESLERQVDEARDLEVETQKKSKAVIRVGERNSDRGAPPDNYKEIAVFPTIDDMEDLRPYIRKNIIVGPYENGHDYVETQFRLLREDFVAPLREGLQNYLGMEASRRKKELKGNSVRYYFNVSCKGRLAALTDSVFLYALQLAPRDYKSVKWERSKRFASGSVIALSNDDFASMIFAFVLQRDVRTLQRGGLSVACCRSEDEDYLEAGMSYSVIESTALFEAYRYNLKVLQDIDPLLVPMEKYIVKLEKTVVPPQFINRGSSVNLSPIMLDERNTCTEVLNSLNWPSRKLTKLDDAQYAAVQSAFARELCLIQGPPGTGKTFVGLLVVETFLLNRITTKPILVVCNTNHALDQFLEGILRFSSKIVRVGGMCRNEDMVQYSLSEMRLKRRDSAVAQRELAERAARHARFKINMLRKEINSYQEISEKAFGKLIPEDALESVSYGVFLKERDIHKWLQIETLAKEFAQKEKQNAGSKAQASTATPEEPRGCSELPEMADEIQSDEEDILIDEKDTDEVTIDVVDRLLSFHGKQESTAMDLFIEHELTVSDRPRLTKEEAVILQCRLDRGLYTLSIDERWDLYRHWYDIYMKELDKKTDRYRDEYSEAVRALRELEAETDFLILQQAQVIGMTTTGAAKYKHLYEKLDIEVVIVEEAAELLEAHIVTTISTSTKQLILIGDHKQLKPATSDYKLARDYHLDVSLFERLVNNGIPYISLELQHRMRPEFVRLLVPHIYQRLDCGPSVYAYPSVKGMSADLQLMSHSHFESNDGENRSKTNVFECDMIVGLVRYLFVHGYTPDQITVLAMYSGQQFLIKHRMRQLNFSLRVTSVDNYQGEENDIVILSFVRSNEEGQIGFLRTMNRLCVAFSRARLGLFCVGNFQMIAQRQPIFKNMLESVADSVRDHFRFQCKAHKTETKVYKPSDFVQVAEGGCYMPCADRLDCGHMCPKLCHEYSNEQTRFKCIRPCLKKYPECGHPCKKQCGEDCDICGEKIHSSFKPSQCSHFQRLCGKREKPTCEKKCEKLLPCGHPCDMKCTQICQKLCKAEVEVVSICGHRVKVACHIRSDARGVASLCRQPCGSLLKCEHTCEGTCGSCYQGRFHVPCQSRCGRTLICGHVCKEPCSRVCPPCKRKCENACIHSHCERTCGEPCVPCAEACSRRCPHQKCSKLCSQKCSVEPCTQPCTKKLKCDHDCIGFCSAKCPDRCRVCDENVCDVELGTEEEDSRYVQLDCGHVIESSGMQKWVETCIKSTEISMGGISCPACLAPVVRTDRFSHHINEKRNLIEIVKAKVFGTPADNKRELERVLARLGHMTQVVNTTELSSFLKDMIDMLSSFKRPDKTTIDTFSNVLTVIERVAELQKNLRGLKRISPKCYALWTDLLFAIRRTLDERVGLQHFEDIINEISRFDSTAMLLKTDRLHPGQRDVLDCFRFVDSVERFSQDKSKAVKDFLDEKSKTLGGAQLGISDGERKMILKAVGLTRGHWYQCPKGHVYCITECGGAMEESKCNECGAIIGGRSHALRGDNRVARAMDGATYSAWSDQQNMQNYRFDELN